MFEDFLSIFIPVLKDFREKMLVELSENQVSFHFKCTI